ncbi:N-acyl homoserine lactonase family protein [Bacillus sp. ISL-35]|uniref:N-acyl homoserine lactonase family protein n=1 Tax=Bacillus sp. ISL-35 TaxID=2819122 RepID=UPI001BEA0BD9|nr:N-acyl homoserine lactonase family protein [Bacillus sp. ISL-35]MBT2679289.1 N-acyl homoserine lactonase family protein [Bacillus sp. ISL-35]MBT2703187.1 N-acyl homoserine lactonase family protein [Chryseobacterium sp. ISL-80]
MKKLIFILTLILSFLLAGSAYAVKKSDYSIKLMEYGGIQNYPKSGLVYGAHNQGTTYLPFFYILIQNKDHNILFDVGYRNDAAKGQKDWSKLFGGTNIEAPAQVLKKVNLTPNDIDIVILSHLHFDHAGNIDQFPKAQFYVQKEELDGWMSSLSLPDKVREWVWQATDLDHINDLLDVAAENRLTLIEEDNFEVAEGVKAYKAKGHTFGTQAITVETRNGTYVLTQDVAYTYENVTDYKPMGLGLDNIEQLMSIHKVNKLVGENVDFIIPGHDMAVFDKYQTEQVGKNRIVTVVK